MPTFSGGSGKDTIRGTSSDDTISGNEGDDLLYGDEGNDLLLGGAGRYDDLRGQAGDDTLDGGPGDGSFNGDEATYYDSPSGIHADLIDGTVKDGFGTTDTLIEIENISGSSFSDTIYGDNKDNTLHGEDGDDYIDGRGGDDRINWGKGNTTVYGGAGDDRLETWGWTTGSGSLVDGGSGYDQFLILGSNTGTILDLSNNQITSSEGDHLTVRNIESFHLETGDSTLLGDASDNKLSARDGEHFANGRAGNDNISVGRGDTVADDTLYGGTGDDTLSSPRGNDTFYGEDGNDIILAGAEHDQIYGGSGDDQLHGETGDDSLFGGTGNDSLDGSHGSDKLYGGEGQNTLTGDIGADTFHVGNGNDLITDFNPSEGDKIDLTAVGSVISSFQALIDRTNDSSQGAQIDLGDGRTLILTSLTAASLQENSFIFAAENSTPTPQNNIPQSQNKELSLKAGESYDFDASDFSFSDEDPNDTLYELEITSFSLSGGSLTLSGDSISPGRLLHPSEIRSLTYTSDSSADESGTATINFKVSDGTDQSAIYTISIDVAVRDLSIAIKYIGDNSADDVIGSDKNDTIKVWGGDDTIEAGSGNDFIVGGDGSDKIDAGPGNDQIFAGADDTQHDTVEGGAGNDVIGGGDGNDLLVGGEIVSSSNAIDAGSDTLFGGVGRDTMVAGSFDAAGADHPRLYAAITNGTSSNVMWGGSSDDLMYGDNGDDVIGGGHGWDMIIAAGGDDIIYGGKAAAHANLDTIDAGSGNDVVYAGTGDDSIVGGDGHDSIFGGSENDTIQAGLHNDEIWGGTGNDSLTGGNGKDIFGFVSGFGADTITDFESGDKLDLTGIDGLTLESLQSSATHENGDTTLTLGEHGTILLQGVDETEFQSFFDAGQILVG